MMDKFQEQFAIPNWNDTQLRIGLTGGIASGKSSVGKFLQDSMHFPILDADVYAHDILSSNSFARDTIIQRYGNKIIKKAAKSEEIIDRKTLAKIIFENKNERLWLEGVLHPIIKMRIIKEINYRKNSPIIILIIPLLFEAKLTNLCTEVWVVNCNLNQQKERLMKRDGLSHDEADQRIKTQIKLEDKIKMADFIIDNSGELNSWEKEIKELIVKLNI
tara:strand:- start:3563 stop:4216 length:654 start_codon:yes stop_codon:yes gene_type:complete